MYDLYACLNVLRIPYTYFLVCALLAFYLLEFHSVNSLQERNYMRVYIYLMDGEYTLPKSDIVCYFDTRDRACPTNGMQQLKIGRASGALFNDSIPSYIRYTGSATSLKGYSRFPVYIGCAYNCVALHPSNNYEFNYFGIRHNRWIADSLSFSLELKMKD